MDQHEALPQDIIIAKLEELFISKESHIQQLEQLEPYLSSVINSNFELFSQKYKILSDSETQSQIKAVIETYGAQIKQIQELFDIFTSRIVKFKQTLVETLKNIPKFNFEPINAVVLKAFELQEKDILDEQDLQWIKYQFFEYLTPTQKALDDEIAQRCSKNVTFTNELSHIHTKFTQQFSQEFEMVTESVMVSLQKLKDDFVNEDTFLKERIKQQQNGITNLRQFNRDKEYQTGTIDLSSSRVLKQQESTEDLIQRRELIKQKMQQHQQQNEKKHCKLNGGGSFGYSWTKGYGVLGIEYPQLTLNKKCQECTACNNEMHSIVTQLYQLEYRDKNTWWVHAWFLYAR